MDFLSILIAATIPVFIVAAVVYMMLNKQLKAENARRSYEIRKDLVKTMTPVKMKAYERMALFLERIKPESLLNRQQLKDVNALQLQKNLLHEIRLEWEHNLTQQLYVSNDSWILLKNAKESMIQLINTCAAQTTLNTSAIDFAKLIIETYQSVDKTPLDAALAMLKSDLSKLA